MISSYHHHHVREDEGAGNGNRGQTGIDELSQTIAKIGRCLQESFENGPWGLWFYSPVAMNGPR